MSSTLIACPGCDSLYRLDPEANSGTAECPCCSTVLRRQGGQSLDTTLALVFLALLLFLAAQAFPLLTLRLHGTTQAATLPDCIGFLARTGWPWLSAVLMVTVELAPGAYLGGLAYVLLQLRQGHPNQTTARVFRLVQEIQGWAMVEVFLLGTLVAYVKLGDLAVVEPGGSLYALAGSVLLVAWAVDSMDAQAIWNAMAERP